MEENDSIQNPDLNPPTPEAGSEPDQGQAGVKEKRRFWRWWSIIPVAVLSAGLVIFLSTWLLLPDIDALKKNNPKATEMMRYRAEKSKNKSGLAKRQYWVSLGRISPYLIQAVIISEDDKFYQHSGFDWDGMREALEKNIDKKAWARGGSTITQQLAKNLYLRPTRNPLRKLREAIIAYQIEKKLKKSRILELYLNVIEWGNGNYGAEAAARYYFSKSALELTRSEAIRLASVLPNPHRYSPIKNTNKRMNNKRQLIASRMLQRGLVDSEQYQALLADFSPTSNH